MPRTPSNIKTFDIVFKRYQDPKPYRASVEIISRTANVLKVAVRAGGKQLLMEKYLFRKKNQWKVSGRDFSVGYDSKRSEMLLEEIQKKIDDFLGKAE